MKAVKPAGDAIAGRIQPGACLALIVGTAGQAIQIPPGAVMCIIEDPANPARMWTWVLTDVRHDRMKFRCACGREGCTRNATFRAVFKGVHPQREGPEAK